MIKKYKWSDSNFGMCVEIAVDTNVFTVEKALEHINFFSNRNYPEEESAIGDAARSHAELCLSIAIQDRVNIHGVLDSMNNQEGYYPVDGSEGIQLISVDGLEINLSDGFSFDFEESELEELPELPELTW